MRGKKKNILNKNTRKTRESLTFLKTDSIIDPILHRGDLLLFKREISDNKGALIEDRLNFIKTIHYLKDAYTYDYPTVDAKNLEQAVEKLLLNPDLILEKPARIAIAIATNNLKVISKRGGYKWGYKLSDKIPHIILSDIFMDFNEKAQLGIHDRILDKIKQPNTPEDYKKLLYLLPATHLKKLAKTKDLDEPLLIELVNYLKGASIIDLLETHGKNEKIWTAAAKKMLGQKERSRPNQLERVAKVLDFAPRMLNETEVKDFAQYIANSWQNKPDFYRGNSDKKAAQRIEVEKNLLKAIKSYGKKVPTSLIDKSALLSNPKLAWFEKSSLSRLNDNTPQFRNSVRKTIVSWPHLDKERKAAHRKLNTNRSHNKS